ncbi:MAG: hypothetical protein ACKVWV_00650 [Planctomycetota bacterium]
MSLHRLLVVIVMTLGLQVPGALTFRVCLCNGLLGGGDAHADARASERDASCCDEQPEDEPVHWIQCAGGTGCRCVLVSTPTQPAASVLPHSPSIDALPSATLVGAVRISEPIVKNCELARTRAHDPPWERANVPLRI